MKLILAAYRRLQKQMVSMGVCLGLAPFVSFSVWPAAAAAESASDSVARGRYLIVIGGCNECHTPGYVEADGKLPESQWLTGSSLGWNGPWGTTYPANLRNFVSHFTEDAWVAYTKHVVTRPPMGWFVLNAMSEQDSRALYRFIHKLGPAGAAAPPFIPPGETPSTAVITYPPPPPIH